MVCVPAQFARKRPEGMDSITGASIPVTGLTAWMMLEIMGRVREGDRVLVHSAGGGVGLMALDLIKFRQAVAVGTASTAKHAFLKERGYDELVDYRKVDFENALAQKPGFDLILDPIGGESWMKNMRLLRPGGRLICFGFSSLMAQKPNPLNLVKHMVKIPWLKFNPIALINANKGIMGVNMLYLWSEADRLVAALDTLMERWSTGHLQPQIHAAVPFEEAAEAHRMLHDRENVGKVVLIS